jgi:fructosamine-3-kinase
MWNILLNEDLTDVSGVIDPLDCCWADSEMDIWNLNHVNGKDYGLLDLYASQFPLSDNYLLKMCFYELFSQIASHYDANVGIEESNIPQEIQVFEAQMKHFGIR